MKQVVAGFLALSCAWLSACGQAPGPGAGPDGHAAARVDAPRAEPPLDDRQQASVMVGLDIARTLLPVRDEVDMQTVERTVRAALAGEKPPLTQAQLAVVRDRFTQRLRARHEAQQAALAETNRQLGEAFFARNAGKPNVRTTASGLQYEVLRAGEGPRPGPADTVRVDYASRLLDGRTVDSTYAVDHAATLALNRVLPGWSEGVQLMPVGSKYRLWVPANLAYGAQGKPGEIEPNAPLVFEVELLEIARGP